jgi:hypothetical protein
VVAGGGYRLRDQGVHDRLLEGGGKLRGRRRRPLFPPHEAEHLRLEAAEREVVRAGEAGARQAERRRRAGRQPLDGGAAREAQPQQPRHLVERLAGGVVRGLAQAAVAAVAGHEHEVCVAAGDDEAEDGEARRWRLLPRWGFGQPGGVDVALQVVDRQKGDVAGVGDRLGGVGADQQRPRQAGAGGHRHGVDVAQGAAGAVQRLVQDGDDRLDVLARGELRHDAAVAGVQLDLGGDDAGEQPAAVADDGGCGLVAGGLDAEDVQAAVSGRAATRRAAQWGIPLALR